MSQLRASQMRYEPQQVLPRICLTFLTLAVATACAGTPATDDGPIRSASGRLEAEVEFEGSVQRGPNTLHVELLDVTGETSKAQLLGVDALMPAHGHQANTSHISERAGVFHVSELDLYMSGRWQIELMVEDESSSDRISFPVDVP